MPENKKKMKEVERALDKNNTLTYTFFSHLRKLLLARLKRWKIARRLTLDLTLLAKR